MIASVERSTVSGEVYVPPSKSYTHRAILITALGPGGVVKRPLISADTRATISASEAFGAHVSLNDEVKIEGVSGKPQTPEDVINVLKLRAPFLPLAFLMGHHMLLIKTSPMGRS
jgi:3-phosphoshikimate 1-carboxyvinyltransferase